MSLILCQLNTAVYTVYKSLASQKDYPVPQGTSDQPIGRRTDGHTYLWSRKSPMISVIIFMIIFYDINYACCKRNVAFHGCRSSDCNQAYMLDAPGGASAECRAPFLCAVSVMLEETGPWRGGGNEWISTLDSR